MCHQDPFATLQNANCSFNLQPVFVLTFGGVTWNVPYWCWEVSCVRIGYYLNQFLCYCQEIYSFAIELYSQKCQCCVFYSYLLVSSTIVDLKEEIALAITDLCMERRNFMPVRWHYDPRKKNWLPFLTFWIK